MSLQQKQKFHRTSRTRKLSKDPFVDDSLVKNSLMIEQKQKLINTLSSATKKQQTRRIQTSTVKRSQMSIDDNYQFVIKTNNNNKQSSQNVQINVLNLANKLKAIITIKQMKAFYRIVMFQIEKKQYNKIVPYLGFVIKGIETNKKAHTFMKLKVNLLQKTNMKTHLLHMAQLHKRKLHQNLSHAFTKVKQQFIKNDQSRQSISLSSTKPQAQQKQTKNQQQFEKFQQSISTNIKQKDYQLAKINILNLIKKFSKQQKYSNKMNVYQSLLQILSEIDRVNNTVKQSQGIFYKMSNFLDPVNVNLSIMNNKQIKKQLQMIKNKLQNSNKTNKPRQSINTKDTNTKDTNQQNLTTKKSQQTYFQTIQKVNDMIQLLFQQLSIKNTQKSTLQQQYQTKIQSLLKQQAEFSKKIQLYQANQAILNTITEKFTETQTLTKQLTEINRRAGKKKGEFPYTFISQLIIFTNQQKKSSLQMNTAIKSLGLLYGRKNLSQEIFNQQKVKLDEKYSTNQLYTNAESQINLLIKNVMDKQRHLIEGEMKKLRNQNDKLNRQLQAQKIKLSTSVSSSLQQNTNTIIKRSSRKGSVQKSQQLQFTSLQNLKQDNKQLQKAIKQHQQQITTLQQQLKAYQQTTLEHDLVQQTLQNLLQKIQMHNDTWRKDVQVLRNGKNPTKYGIIFRILSLVKKPIEQNKQFSDSFQTLIYNSKKSSLIAHKVSEQQVVDNNSENNTNNILLGQKIESTENLSPQKQQNTIKNDNSPSRQQIIRVSERISWDLSSRVNQLDPKVGSSYILQDNLLDDQSDILGMMRESNLLDFQGDNVRNVEVVRGKRMSLGMVEQQRKRLNNNNTNNNVTNGVTLQQMQQLNTLIVKLMSEQSTFKQIRQKQLPQLLRNSLLANLVIMIQSYMNASENVKELLRQKQGLQMRLRQSEQGVVNQRRLKQWLKQCAEQIQNNDNDNDSLSEQTLSENNSRYWQQKLQRRSLQQPPCIIVMQVARLMTKYTQYLLSKLSNYNNTQSPKNTPLNQQPKHQLQQQTQQQQQLIQSLQRQLKQNQLKYQHQLQYYQGLQEQSHCSPQPKVIERTVKTSRSVKSIRSNNNNQSVSQSKNHAQKDNMPSYNVSKIEQLKSHYKLTIQELSKQEKKLLQQIQTLNIKNNNILQLISAKDIKITQLNNRLEQTLKQNKSLQSQLNNNNNNQLTYQLQIKQKYQQQFFSLRQQLEKVKQQIFKQLQIKQDEVTYFKDAYNVLLKKYQQMYVRQKLQEKINKDKNIKQQNLQQQNKQQLNQQKQQKQQNHQQQNHQQQHKDLSNYISNNNYTQKQQISSPNINQTSPMQQTTLEQQPPIKQVDQNTYLVTQHSIQHTGSAQQTYRQISQLQQLRMQVKQLQAQRNHVIQSQVLKALKSQQQQFNNFYRENMIRMEEHFVNQVIPQRVKQAQLSFININNNNNQVSINNNNTQLSSASQLLSNNQHQQSQHSQQQFLQQKYQQWKLTYLPVILQLKQKEWRQHYQQTQLQVILNQKYLQWQSIKLLSIMRQEENNWIINELLKDTEVYKQNVQLKHKLTELNNTLILNQTNNIKSQSINTITEQQLTIKIQQINLYWQQEINKKIREVEEYWQTIAFPAALKSELIEWNIKQQVLIQQKIKEVQNYWQQTILPKRIKQYQQKHQQQLNQTHLNHTLIINKQLQSNISQIINAKYQQWKQTYLKQYLIIQKQKWLQQYKRTELQKMLLQRQSQWQKIRLLSIIKEKRNQWIVDIIVKEILQKQNSNKHSQQQQQQLLRDQLYKHQQHLKLVHDQQLKSRIIQVQQYWQHALQTQRLAFTQTLNKALKQRTIQIQKYFHTIVLPNIKSQWQLTYTQQILQREEQNKQKSKIIIGQIKNNTDNIKDEQSIIQSYIQSQQFSALIINKRQQWLLQMRQLQQLRMNQIISRYQLKINNLEKSVLHKQGQLQQQVLEMRELQLATTNEIRQLQSANSQLRTIINNLQQNINQLQHQISILQTDKTTTIIANKNINQQLLTKQTINKLQTDYINQLNQAKLYYQNQLTQANNQKNLLNLKIKQLQTQNNQLLVTINKNMKNTINNNNNTNNNTKTNNQTTKQSTTTTHSITTIQNNYQKQLLSLQSTIRNKQSQLTFIKKSLESITLQNQQLHQRISVITNKKNVLEQSLEDNNNRLMKIQYQLKYSKQKQTQFNKKLQSKQIQYNQYKQRLQLQKSLIQKKLNQSSTTTQNLTILQLKINQLQSQLSISQSTVKNLEQQLEKKRNQLLVKIKTIEQLNAVQASNKERYQLEIVQYKANAKLLQSTINKYELKSKQYQSINQQLKAQIRHYNEQINKLKYTITQLTNNNLNNSSTNNNRYNNRQQQQLQPLIIQIQRLKLQNYRLKQHLLKIQSEQTTHIHQLKSHIQLLEQKLYTANLYHHQGEVTEIEILNKINTEISELVTSNKQLQLRIIVLENQKKLTAFGISIQRFFVAFHQQMDNLINYLLKNSLFNNQLTLGMYNKFMQKSREALTHGYVEDYFRQWQSFMRACIEENLLIYKQHVQLESQHSKKEQKQQHHHQKEGVNQQQQGQRQQEQYQNEQQVDNIIQKYDTVLNDVKFTLVEFIKTGDHELLQLMARSLGVDLQNNQQQHIEENNGKEYRFDNNQRKLVRQ